MRQRTLKVQICFSMFPRPAMKKEIRKRPQPETLELYFAITSIIYVILHLFTFTVLQLEKKMFRYHIDACGKICVSFNVALIIFSWIGYSWNIWPGADLFRLRTFA